MGKIVKESAVAYRWTNATANCPDGTKLTGGGGRCIYLGPPGTGYVYLRWNYPLNEKKWVAGCDTPIHQNVRAEAYAICGEENTERVYNLKY